MKSLSIILVASLASIFAVVGTGVLAAPDSIVTQRDGSTPLSAQEQNELIQEALSLVNAESTLGKGTTIRVILPNPATN